MNFRSLILILLLTILHSPIAMADSINKHPRVADLEDNLRNQATAYLKARFPDQPFSVNASVDPVRRSINPASTAEKEILPFYDSAEDEIKDEWDDPSLTLQQLLLRTKKVALDISVSDSVNDTEKTEIKEALYQSLHLIPARDDIKLESKKWSSAHSENRTELAGLAAIFIFLIGLAIVQRSSYGKLAKSLAKVQFGSGTSAAVAQPIPSAIATNLPSSKPTQPMDVELSDPMQAREIIKMHLSNMQQNVQFPSLRAMIELDQTCKLNPGLVGGLLFELPEALRNEIFLRGNGNHWYVAMLEPNSFGMAQVSLFEKILRLSPRTSLLNINDILIGVWRMEDKRDSFLRSIGKDSSFALLYQFPKDLAISYAKKAFPGAWADLLNSNFQPKIIDKELHSSLSAEIAKLAPLLNLKKVAVHKQELEILEYLKSCSPAEEREIYLASPAESSIHHLRNPFYSVLDASDSELQVIVPQFHAQQWAIALSDVAAEQRKPIEEKMSEKQQAFYQEKRTQFAQQRIDIESKEQARVTIASKYQQVRDSLKSKDGTELAPDQSNGDSNEAQAA